MRTILMWSTLGFLAAGCQPAADAQGAFWGEVDQAIRAAPFEELYELEGAAQAIRISWDHRADGDLERVKETFFNRRGQRILEREDRDGDAWFETATAWHHVYEAGLLVLTDIDEEVDGGLDAVETREYNDFDQLVLMVHDAGVDGEPDRVEEHVWDADGRRIQQAVEDVRTGTQSVQAWSWGLDGDLLERSSTRWRHGELQPSPVYHDLLDEHGRVAAVEVDLHGDGLVDNVMTRAYSRRGQLEAVVTDRGADGSVDSITRYVYDERGRQIEVDIDHDADGATDTQVLRDYLGEPRGCACPSTVKEPRSPR